MTPPQAVLIYCMERALSLAEELKCKEKEFLKEKIDELFSLKKFLS